LSALGDGERILAEQVRTAFDRYFDSALTAARILMGQAKGDASAAIATMQKEAQTVTDQLASAHEESLATFRGLLTGSAASVNTTLTVSITSTFLMIVALGVGSWFLIGSVFRSLGGEPEAAVTVVRRIATGDFSGTVPVAHGDSGACCTTSACCAAASAA
jgi:methyl-accepting chemotaxis protein